MAAVSASFKVGTPGIPKKNPRETASKVVKSASQRVNVTAKAISGGVKKSYTDRAHNVIFKKQADNTFLASVPVHLSSSRYAVGSRLSVSCGCGGGAPTVIEIMA